MPRFVQTVKAWMPVGTSSVYPRRFRLEDEPLLVVQGVADLNPDPRQQTLPLWFDAEVQVFSDGTTEIISFGPTYGSIHGAGIEEQLTGIYQHAFSRALVDTKLKILGHK